MRCIGVSIEYAEGLYHLMMIRQSLIILPLLSFYVQRHDLPNQCPMNSARRILAVRCMVVVASTLFADACRCVQPGLQKRAC